MMKFINKHKILYVKQFGFRKDFSTTLALIDIVDKIKFALDNNEYAVGVFLDIKKAFDSINHNILIQKLEFYGFRGHISTFIRSYLTNRQQYTVVNNINSKTQPSPTRFNLRTFVISPLHLRHSVCIRGTKTRIICRRYRFTST